MRTILFQKIPLRLPISNLYPASKRYLAEALVERLKLIFYILLG
ncbi:hypothetical protein AIOGIFDO_00449 [Candidatus Methanoperedenaceae archaeon GB37]|nr:hypothetical protein AIOGIFDO_00449 [Candidatus Methanoperedenaceae archaeon GB37]